jgi:hypothetical protein
MSLAEERLRVLRLVETGTISAEEGARLLAEAETAPSPTSPVERPDKARWMRICVTDLATSQPKVNIRLPASLVDVGLRMGAQFLPGASAAQVAELLKSVTEGRVGKVAEVEDPDNGERVEIFV